MAKNVWLRNNDGTRMNMNEYEWMWMWIEINVYNIQCIQFMKMVGLEWYEKIDNFVSEFTSMKLINYNFYSNSNFHDCNHGRVTLAKP